MEKTACRVICKYTFVPQEDTWVHCRENKVTGKKKKKKQLPLTFASERFFLRFKSKQTSSYTCLYGPVGRAGHSSNNTIRLSFLLSQYTRIQRHSIHTVMALCDDRLSTIDIREFCWCMYVFSVEFTGPLTHLEVKVFSGHVWLWWLWKHTYSLSFWEFDEKTDTNSCLDEKYVEGANI